MVEQLTMEMNEFLPLRDVVFQTLRSAILKGSILPGERLMEIHLADKLGVSRTPVREAIRMLEQEGLVVMIPRKGATVAEITVSELVDVLEIRMTLEELAMKRACRNVTPEWLEKLEVAEQEFQKVIAENNDVEAWALADEKFHNVIYEMTGNRRLIQLLSNLREQMYRYRMEYLKNRDAHESLVEEHKEIIRALKQKDEVVGIRTTDEHINRQREKIISILEEKNQ